MRVGARTRIVGGLVLVLVGQALALVPSSASAEDAADLAPVDVVEVSGLIDEVNAQAIENAIERSSGNGAQALVLQVNSRGAVVGRERMEEVLSAIAGAPVPVAIWVGPSGSRALGMAAQMLAVADVTAMAPGARMGRTGTMLEVDGERLTFGAADDEIRRGTVGFLEARELGILRLDTDDTGVPVVRNMLFALDGLEIDGRVLDTVVEVGGTGTQVTREATTARFFKLDAAPRIVHTVASPPSAYLLVVIGLALVLFEFFTAGIGVAGLVGAVSLVLGATGFGALPMNGWAVALLVVAFLAFAVDVQVGVPRLWTAAGMAMFIVASFSLFRPVDGMTLRPSWITLSVGIGGIALTYVVGMPSMVRTRFATPTIGRENLVGAEGVASGAIDPEGTVVVHGARWRARTNRATPLVDGAAVRVAAIDGITLEVEPLEGAARDYREARTPRP